MSPDHNGCECREARRGAEVTEVAPPEAVERVAARYDALAETHPIYAGMWRAQARILRREHERLHATAPANGGAT